MTDEGPGRERRDADEIAARFVARGHPVTRRLIDDIEDEVSTGQRDLQRALDRERKGRREDGRHKTSAATKTRTEVRRRLVALAADLDGQGWTIHRTIAPLTELRDDIDRAAGRLVKPKAVSERTAKRYRVEARGGSRTP